MRMGNLLFVNLPPRVIQGIFGCVVPAGIRQAIAEPSSFVRSSP